MSFLLPGMLAALAALLLPILIHLSRRSQSQRVDFAAMRWLQAKLRPRRRPVIEQWLLLLVRLLLLLCLILFLAQPVRQQAEKPGHWLVVVPGTSWQSLSGLPAGEQVQRRWLAPSFPAIDSPPPSPGAAGFSSLIRELDAQLPKSTALTVVLPESLNGLDAERLRLSRTINWRVVPGRMPERSTSAAIIPALAIRSDATSKPSEVFFKAAFAVWQNESARQNRQAMEIIANDTQAPAKAGLWIDLRNQPLSDAARQWVMRGGRLMLGPATALPQAPREALWRDNQGNAILLSQSLGKGQLLQWQRPLNAQALPMLEYGDFPARFYALVQNPMPAPGRALASTLQARSGVVHSPVAPQPLTPWFALAAVLLFVLERWLASSRSRWSGS
jgi:hypothetical protein